MPESQVVTNVENFKVRIGKSPLATILKSLKSFKKTKMEDNVMVEFSMYAKSYGLSINASKAHTLEISVLYGSEDVGFLSKVKAAQESGVFLPISFEDTDGGGEWSADVAVIQKDPVVEWAKDSSKILTYTLLVPYLAGSEDAVPRIIGLL